MGFKQNQSLNRSKKINFKKQSYQTGFTIVELLIVIVVIAILAAITIVAYQNIQKRASIAAVKSDLSSAMRKLKAYSVVSDRGYPVGDDADLNTLGIKISTKNYFTVEGQENFLYCQYERSDGSQIAGFGAIARTGDIFTITTDDSEATPYTKSLPGNSAAEICPGLLNIEPGDPKMGYESAYRNNGGWKWAQWALGGSNPKI